MTLYAVIKDQKLLLITDCEADAQAMAEKEKGVALETDNIQLSNGAQADISASYEMSCVEESVRTVLREKGIDEDADPAGFEELAASIAADAYRSMIKYDTDEEYSIDEAMKEHAAEVSALLEKSETN